jgi:dipeptidyl aminopeptidase/acylaminoacyl peptidase
MIETMRQQTYPGSKITIEETLEPGSNYERYIASYLSEGLRIYALLTIPHGERPESGWPVVIFNHGYIPPAQYRTTERYVAYVDAFARNGYIVFRSDYRGHGNSEGEAAGGYGSPAYTIDVLNAVAAIKDFPDADPARIGMWGHSMGGHITLRAMVTTSDIKAGVIWAGVVASYPDLFERWRRPDSNGESPAPTPDLNSRRGRWRRELLETYGSPEDNPEFWAAISPNSYLGELSGPVQLHHGTADSSVPVEFTEILQSQIQAVEKPVELYLYEGDNHNISASFGTAMERSIRFFDIHVKGTEGTWTIQEVVR